MAKKRNMCIGWALKEKKTGDFVLRDSFLYDDVETPMWFASREDARGEKKFMREILMESKDVKVVKVHVTVEEI
tara:strand:- start:10194 stop:10415 length:222 start_codon:yes stop_codon:yes gene_type:complete